MRWKVSKVRLSLVVLGTAASCAHSPASTTSSAQETTTPADHTVVEVTKDPSPAELETQPSAPTAAPGVEVRELTYSSGSSQLKGFIAYPKSQDPRPGVLVVHEWWGLNDYVRDRARQLAEEGYVAMAIDMYGGGKNTVHVAEAKEFANKTLSDLQEAEARFRAAMAVLKDDPRVDREKRAAIGYCFGGGTVLHMARTGADLDVVASFHGTLVDKKPMKRGAFKGKILVATGGADPFVPAQQVAAFREEMKAAGVDHEIVVYPGAKHAFTNPQATAMGQANDLPLAYSAEADADSWQKLLELLADM